MKEKTMSDLVKRFLFEVFRISDGTEYLECIYHYTTANVLERFLAEDGDLLCTHYRALNDDSEFREGFKRVLQYARKMKWNANLLDRIRKLGDHFNEKDIFMPWIFSFSLHNDMLSQWIGYTDQKDGGYAIGFDREQLRKLAEEKNKISQKTPTKVVLNCVYSDVDDVDANLDEIFLDSDLTSYVHSDHLVLDSDLTSYVHSDHLVMEKETKLLFFVMLMSSMIKEKSFFQESETRLLLFVDDEKLYRDVISIGGKPRMRANLSEKPGYLRDLIKSVVISPHGNQNLLYANALSLKRKYSLGYSIVTSASNYRG